MSSREIVLWLDKRWYDALERHGRLAKLLEYLRDRELTQPEMSMEMRQTLC